MNFFVIFFVIFTFFQIFFGFGDLIKWWLIFQLYIINWKVFIKNSLNQILSTAHLYNQIRKRIINIRDIHIEWRITNHSFFFQKQNLRISKNCSTKISSQFPSIFPQISFYFPSIFHQNFARFSLHLFHFCTFFFLSNRTNQKGFSKTHAVHQKQNMLGSFRGKNRENEETEWSQKCFKL